MSLPCPQCEYDLTHTIDEVCPESGARFDRQRLLRPPPRRIPGRVFVMLFALCAVHPMVVATAALFNALAFPTGAAVLLVVAPISLAGRPVSPSGALLLGALTGPILGLTLMHAWGRPYWRRVVYWVVGAHVTMMGLAAAVYWLAR